MTIRDMEFATGLSRANIRFYEEQGLIAPRRQSNGYREYDQSHADILLRVKLLRALGMSIERIRGIARGETDLAAALDEQIALLDRQRQQLDNSSRVCRQMRSEGAAFPTLDAKRYLYAMENPPDPASALKADVQPRVFGPWRRYFARSLDLFVYAMLLALADFYLFPGDMSNAADTVGLLLLTLLLEPVQLRLFGTTLGKWIFGIRVTGLDGYNLFWSEAFDRTAKVLLFGMGLNIPLLSLWRNWRGYQRYADGQDSYWEENSELTIRDASNLRFLAAVGTAAVAFVMTFLLAIPSYRPPNRGDLTVAEFVENYRFYAETYGLDQGEYELREDGTWQKVPQAGTAVIYLGGNSAPVNFVFTADEAGHLTAVSFSQEITGDRESWLGTHESQQLLTAMAFCGGREEFHFLKKDDSTVVDAVNDSGGRGYSVRVADAAVECRVETRGYLSSSAGLIPDDGYEEEPWFFLEFRVSLLK